MGLLAKLFKDSSDSEFKLAQDLVAIAVADGNISDVERQEIMEICQTEGIHPDIIKDCFSVVDPGAVAHVPIRHIERVEYIENIDGRLKATNASLS